MISGARAHLVPALAVRQFFPPCERIFSFFVPLAYPTSSPNSSRVVAMAGERIFTDGMTACLLGRGELNKLKLSYFPFAFLRAKLWTGTFEAWLKLYLCPHARDVWGPQRSSS